MKFPNGIRIAAAAVFSAALAAGCATVGPSGPSDEEQVVQLAQERWDLLLAGKLEAAYGYLSPAQRSAISLTDYQRKVLSSKVRWLSGAVESAECAELTCTANVKLRLQLLSAVPGVSKFEIDQNVEEKWIKSENRWWFVPK